MNTQHQFPSSPPPPPHTHREYMAAELFLGEEEEEVEESPLPTKSADCYRSRLQSRQGQDTHKWDADHL